METRYTIKCNAERLDVYMLEKEKIIFLCTVQHDWLGCGDYAHQT